MSTNKFIEKCQNESLELAHKIEEIVDKNNYNTFSVFMCLLGGIDTAVSFFNVTSETKKMVGECTDKIMYGVVDAIQRGQK